LCFFWCVLISLLSELHLFRSTDTLQSVIYPSIMLSSYQYSMNAIIHAKGLRSFYSGAIRWSRHQTVLTPSIRRPNYPSPTTRLSKVSSHDRVGNQHGWRADLGASGHCGRSLPGSKIPLLLAGVPAPCRMVTGDGQSQLLIYGIRFSLLSHHTERYFYTYILRHRGFQSLPQPASPFLAARGAVACSRLYS
jgi:hypothetical protein